MEVEVYGAMESPSSLDYAMPDHLEPPHEGEEILAARLTGPTDTLPEDPLAQVAAPEFPTVMRGYERGAVEAYVERVSRLVAELHASRSPREAVRQALERVGAETTEILRRAHDSADKVTSDAQAEAAALAHSSREEADLLGSTSRAEAEELTARAQREAAALDASSRAEAEARTAEAERQAAATLADAQERLALLDRDIDAIWQERQRLIDDVRRVASELGGLAGEAEARYPAEEPAERPEPAPEPVLDASGPEGDIFGATVEIPAAEQPDAGWPAEDPPAA